MYNEPKGFFVKAKQTVYKWWCVVYRPVYKLCHNGNWPIEKEPGYTPPQTTQGNEQAYLMANQILQNNIQNQVDQVIDLDIHKTASPSQQNARSVPAPSTSSNDISDQLSSIMNANKVDISSYIEEGRANSKQLSSIMKANSNDISSYIEEGRAQRAREETPADIPPAVDDEAAKRAQEIIDRLNREAAMDEAKKQAEIDAAKKAATEKFGG